MRRLRLTILIAILFMTAFNGEAQTNEFGKVLNVKKVKIDGVALDAMSAYLDSLGVEFEDVDVANWPEYNKQTPTAQFRIVHTGDAIVLNYRVSENSVAATADATGHNVWEDACMEFFSSPNPGDGIYYNLECNCAGTMLMDGGVWQTERQAAPIEVLESVKRWSSLGREPFAECVGRCTWQVVLVVPATAFYLHKITDFSGLTFRANFYKCGDHLQQPHFLSWNPVSTPKPNFHQPPFFGTIEFEK